MEEIKLEVDGRKQSFHQIWVHLQDISHSESVEYRISVGAANIGQVFDPYGTKATNSSWSHFIQNLIAELGTFIVEGFIDKMAAIVGTPEKSYIWVIATVDEVKETEKGIALIGRAVPFMPHR